MEGKQEHVNFSQEKIMSALRKILVVDDDPVVGKSFDRVLTGKGYAVITAQTGEEALLKLNNEHYDLVFTDIKMPGMSGLEVAERVRASQPWLPVVVVTGYGTSAYEARAEAAGVSGFLNKPLSPAMIEESAEKALHHVPATVTEAPAFRDPSAVAGPRYRYSVAAVDQSGNQSQRSVEVEEGIQ